MAFIVNKALVQLMFFKFGRDEVRVHYSLLQDKVIQDCYDK